jgi:branched-chain amino acid transport system ATP-binding protein
MSLLEVNNIEAMYGDLKALFGISLSINPGEVHSVIGANGAGKSTLLKVIAGTMAATSGSLTFDGRDLANLSAAKRVRAGVSLVPEGRRIFSSLTVEENLKVGAYSRRKGHWNLNKIRELYPLLSERWDRIGFHCSGGELQMLAIGRALMANPDLLLIDEASLGLAPVVVAQVYASLPQITSQGTAVLLVEQDMQQALRASTHTSVLLEGKVVLEGSSSTLNKDEIKRAYFGMEGRA